MLLDLYKIWLYLKRGEFENIYIKLVFYNRYSCFEVNLIIQEFVILLIQVGYELFRFV